jgi:hypothetical protein
MDLYMTGMAALHDNGIVIVVMSLIPVIQSFLTKRNSWNSRLELPLLAFILLFLAFSFLFIKWHTGNATHSIGGFIPFSDANGYYHGARHLMEFGQLTDWTARRPLASCFYAAVMAVVGQDLKLTFIVSAVLISLALLYSASVLRRIFGFAGAFYYAVLSAYYVAPYVGTFMSEIPGIVYANLAFGLLVDGVSRKKYSHFCLGLFLLGLAISARAGAFFVLPLLVVFSVFVFAAKGKGRYLYLGGTLVVVVSSLAYSPLSIEFMKPDGEHAYQGNFSYVLYGLASGGKGWDYVNKEHSELLADTLLTDGTRSRLIYKLAYEKIMTDPELFAKALFNTYYHIVRNPFDFTYKMKFPLPIVVFLPSFILFWIGLLFVSDYGRRNVVGLVVAFVAGTFLSAPFLVDGGERAFAVTMPASLAVIAIGTSYVFRLFTKSADVANDSDIQGSKVDRKEFVCLSACTLLILIVPFSFVLDGKGYSTSATSSFSFRFIRSSALPISTTLTKKEYQIPVLSVFGIDSRDSGALFMNAVNLSSERDNYYLYLPPDKVPVRDGLYTAELEKIGKPFRDSYLYKVNSISTY